MPKTIPANPGRILFVRLSAVGDVINTLPALEALRQSFPQAHIGYLVEDRAYTAIEGHPSVDEVLLYPRKRWVAMLKRPGQWATFWHEFNALRKRLRAPRYDIALNFQSNLKGALFALLSGALLRVGFGRNNSKENSYLFNHIQVSPEGGELINRVEKFITLSAAIGADPSRAAYRLPERPDRRKAVQDWLGQMQLSQYAVIHPGTSDFGAQKRWLPERFAELARRLKTELGLTPIITWGPGEQELAQHIVSESGDAAVLAMQTSHLLDLADITRHARLYVGCDSGPLHLASAVGAPSVALFGPKDPRTYAPWNPHSRVVQKASTETPYWGNMIDITVDDVMNAAKSLLDEVSAT